ncbi:MAG: DPP IV N-terminal domain-containing protein, partial [Actinomycetota bacterium]|nr:DPP IV N-terminal domain-containing protein [Actinomycetota bacterium]
FFSAGEITRMNQMADLLAEVTRGRARAHGFAFIDSRPAFMGHAWCENEWINGLSNPTSNSFHPNKDGFQGYAGIVRGAMLATPDPGFSRGNNGRIAFSRGPDGSSEIYVINGNGTFPFNLTGNPADDRVPSFSPDGNRIVFASDRDGDYEIYTMNSTGGEPTKLTSNTADDFDPSWSPNGKQIVFRSSRDGNNEIYKMDSNGLDQRRLTNNSASDFAPSFSPDGAEIAFQRFSTGGNNEVFKMNADGQGQTNLSNNAANDGAPQWSPDGSQIAFHSNRTSSNFDIYTMPATGGTATRRTTATGEDRNPTWAPSGSHIAFQSERDGSAQLYTMTPTGASQTRRTSGGELDRVPSWQGDATRPQTTIDSGPPAVTNNPVANFTFSADEAGSTFECQLGSSTFQSCSSPYSTAVLADGSHTFSVRATDPSGNLDTSPATRSFQIDTAAKVSEITAGPSGPTNVTEPVFEFTSEDTSVTFECRLDHSPEPGGPDAGWEDCVSPHQVGPLADGDHRFEVRGTDGVGNIEPEPQIRQFTVDTVKPETTITFAPPALGTEAAPKAEFVSENGAAFECRLTPAGETEGVWVNCESPHSLGPAGTDGLEDGDYTFEVRATDPAGNQEEEAAGTFFTIDTAPPATTVTEHPGTADQTTDVSFAFTADDPEATFECRLDGLEEIDWAACQSPVEYEDVVHGRHRFQARATDPAGNVEAEPADIEFGVKNDPGHRITARPDPLSGDSTPAFEFESLDPDATYECRLDGDDWEPCASPFAIPHKHYEIDEETGEQTELPVQVHDEPLADGPHMFELRATDWFGEVTTLPAYEWTIATGAPAAEIVSGPAQLSNTGAATFLVEPGFGATALECSIDDTEWQTCGSQPFAPGRQTVEYSGLFDQVHEFKVRSVSILHENPGPEAVHTWRVDTKAPQLSFSGGPSARTRTTSANFQFTAADPLPHHEPNPIRFWCRSQGSGPFSLASPNGFEECSTPISLSGLSEGRQTFEVLATDRAGNASPVSTRSWTIDLTGPKVALIEVPPAATDETSARFVFSADEPGTIFSCRLNGASWFACQSPHETGTMAAGANRFSVRATDSLGNIGEPAVHDWTVSKPAPPPARPAIRFQGNIRIKPARPARLATVNCPAGGACRVTVPKRVMVVIGGKRFPVRLKAPKRIAAGRTAGVTGVLPRKAHRRLGRRTVKFSFRIKVTTNSGASRVAKRTVRLRR